MKCEDCKKETDGIVCKNCGLVIVDRPISINNNGYSARNEDITTLYSVNHRIWSHPLSPNIRSASRAFKPRYQKKYIDYVYIKAYESIGKLCSQLKLPMCIKYETLNLFKGLRKLEPDFFKTNKLAPTYLACIKIACRLNDYPLSNMELYEVIDYDIKKQLHTRGHMEKKFNKAYRAVLKLYKLRISIPEHPNFINFACNKLNLPHVFITQIHKKYTILKKYFQPHFWLEGYILGLIMIYGKTEYGLKNKQIEETFHISMKTITNRKNEILKILKRVNR